MKIHVPKKELRPWWQQPLRIIQPNMQVKDTRRINPEKLADQMVEMGANAMVFNTGGIYAWYPSGVKYHVHNEYLPQDSDLLRDMINCCHQRGIRFIARFDFSKAEDSVYLQRPQWFARREGGQPEIIGATRPGAWPLLMSTCINGGYRNEGLAVPVIREALQRYEIDGVFFNAPGYIFCRCSTCQEKYKDLYGVELPASSAELDPEFSARCFDDNLGRMYEEIKAVRPEVPMILYYNLHRDHLEKRVSITDMLCTEPQDVLSLGYQKIPEFWQPALSIKVGRSVAGRPDPFGIIHSCPGMDWRHTGLPPAEYRFWLSQIPANGGQLWHSLTGIPDTITDQRILRTVREVNTDAEKLASYMDGAQPVCQVALLWNADRSAEGLAEALIHKQIPFDVILPEQVANVNLHRYKVILLPEGCTYPPGFAGSLHEYVKQGGSVLAEGPLPMGDEQTKIVLADLFGIAGEMQESEYLFASYLRFETTVLASEGTNPLQRELEETELIPHRGKVTYCQPVDHTDVLVLATLVPPFSPLESVGAPPERASLAVKQTELPMALLRTLGSGKACYLPFSLSSLIQEFKLEEHFRLFANAVDLLLNNQALVSVTSIPGLQLTVFRNDDFLLIHLVNGAGRRPLSSVLPLHNIEIIVGSGEGCPAGEAEALISGDILMTQMMDGKLKINVPRLHVWECIRIPLLI
ncbi:alpha-amylase family protein [Paenibacillus pabuli]|uniref:alpha-amylase family protein n=1 Tax=Paenibacillus pabuli TaxID=1472 RepID=UPI001FFEB485|nr:alpha-amylase family protein [Paenibacillus pabuli]UPK44933.1 family 10 glycosylhydrolase [Paenibacillus pabuli]